ncbi:chaplin [Streptomyces sp. NPDC058257]|uniref:chaplin n=1 Tax=Streptomyces sp. NPDC058257 TaxID=3346409 RepID=UPI0036EAC9FF
MRQAIGKGMLATAAAATSILSLSGSNAFAVDGNAVAAGSPGVLSGNSVQAPVEVPLNACGNSADAVGVANPAFGNSCANTGSAPKKHAHAEHTSAEHASTPHRAAAPKHAAPKHAAPKHAAPERAPQQRATTKADNGPGYGQDTDSRSDSRPDTHSGSNAGSNAGTHALAESGALQSPGILAGNNAQAPADVPVNACGNTVDVIGVLNPAMGNSCANGAPSPTPPQQETPPSHEMPPTPPRAAEPPADRAVPQPRQPGQPPRHVASSTDRQVPSADPVAPHASARLAETGSDQDLMAATAASAALLLGGGILYRRGRASSRR